MADGAFGLSKELAEETAPVWEKVKDHVTPLEWPQQARLISEINRLKRERDAVILAHNYMTPEIFHGVGDYVGDSLGLAKEAAKSKAKVIVQAGVHFMAETSKILSPDKTVLIPDLRAGCSLASSITGAISPSTTRHHIATSRKVVRLPRTVSQKGSARWPTMSCAASRSRTAS